MPGDSAQSDSSLRDRLLGSVLDQLACPACLASLRMDATALLCSACGNRYPIVDGIPVLIATPPSPEEAASS